MQDVPADVIRVYVYESEIEDVFYAISDTIDLFTFGHGQKGVIKSVLYHIFATAAFSLDESDGRVISFPTVNQSAEHGRELYIGRLVDAQAAKVIESWEVNLDGTLQNEHGVIEATGADLPYHSVHFVRVDRRTI